MKHFQRCPSSLLPFNYFTQIQRWICLIFSETVLFILFILREGCIIVTKFWWHNINSKQKEIHCNFCNLPAWEQSFCSKHCKHPFRDVVKPWMTHSFLRNVLILHQNPACIAYQRKQCPKFYLLLDFCSLQTSSFQ